MFCAVHIGAGSHSRSKEAKYLALCKLACKTAMDLLNNQQHPMEALVAAIKVLEDCPLTNAGTGSNLNINGMVECDASIMDGRDGSFGSVSCLSNVRNPIAIAKLVLNNDRQGQDPTIGIIPPIMIAGNQHLKDTAHNQSDDSLVLVNLVTTEQREKYVKYKGWLDDSKMAKMQPSSSKSTQKNTRGYSAKRQKLSDDSLLQDTVGAIVIDAQGSIVSGVSSGGIWLKPPGRIGEAACFGCGCWAENYSVLPTASTDEFNSLDESIAISVTGTGEQIMRTRFAESACDIVLGKSQDSLVKKPVPVDQVAQCISSYVDAKFIKHPWIQKRYREKCVGFIMVNKRRKAHCPGKYEHHLWFGHTTQSLGVGWMSIQDVQAQAIISRKDITADPNSLKIVHEARAVL